MFLKIDNKLKMRIPLDEFTVTPSKFHYSLFQCDATSVETCNTGDPKDITHALLAQALTPKWKRHQRGRRSVTSNNNDTIDNTGDDVDDDDTSYEAPKFDLQSSFEPEVAKWKSKEEEEGARQTCEELMKSSASAKSCIDATQGEACRSFFNVR